jgi:hypothetical protein
VVIDVLDPRYDAEPAYWAALRERAGLRADWSWPVLATQAWAARTPQPVTVFRDGPEPWGVVGAAWVTGRTRRYRFTGSGRGRLGGLVVRAPGVSSLPGWWFAGPDGGLDCLLDAYVPAMRAELGPGFRAMLVRQLGEPAGGGLRLVRRTEDVAVLDVARFGTRDDWLQSLARKRKQNLRKIFRTVEADPSIEVRLIPGREADPVAVAEVLRHNERKHRDVPIVALPHFTGYLTVLLRQPDVFVAEYRDPATGRLLAAGSVLDHPRLPIARHWGALAREDGGRPNLYFHFYGEVVKWALAAGRPSVLFGKGMAELKATLGARLVPQYAAAVPVLPSRRHA